MEAIFTLENFEGPLDFLLHLIQKNEIDIYDISIHKITDQYLAKLKEYSESSVDQGADFIGTLATLLLLKSRMLLPKHEGVGEEEEDPHFHLIYQLIDYCRFKEAAKRLNLLEFNESAFYYRGIEVIEEKKKPQPGAANLSLEDLAKAFQEAIKRHQPRLRSIQEEVYSVVEKKLFLQNLLKEKKELSFYSLFSEESSKEEWIVTFLAVLELMKQGEVVAIKDFKTQDIQLYESQSNY
jgi:segregation and condensation protein A